MKLFRPVPKWEPVLLLMLSCTDFRVIPRRRVALGHTVCIHPAQKSTAFPQETRGQRAPGIAKREDDPKELGRSRAPYVLVQPGTSWDWDTLDTGQRSAIREGLVHETKTTSRKEPETSKQKYHSLTFIFF